MGGWNRIIAGVSYRDRERWGSQLAVINLKAGDVLSSPGSDFEYVYFPINCIISLSESVAENYDNGFTLIGNEGMVGASVFLGDKANTFFIKVECGGEAYCLPVDVASRGAHQSRQFQYLMLNYMQALVFSALQSAVCDGAHTLLQRVINAILMCDDRLHGSEIDIDRGFIQSIVGAPIELVLKTIDELRLRNLIRCRNEYIKIVDRVSLENASCECYRMVKNEFDRLLPSI